MEFGAVVRWMDGILSPGDFDDVSNNGIQIARRKDEVGLVAFAVDASLRSVRDALGAGADMLVVHHGISWGGGIRRLVGAEYEIAATAIGGDLALYASHLPLDANERVGNNWEIARHIGLECVSRAFSYHGNVIGVVGTMPEARTVELCGREVHLPQGRIGVCSGGAGEFATAAKALGCNLFITGEASWGDMIAAENVGMDMLCLGHYETETFGVRALARTMSEEIGVRTVFLPRESIQR